VVDTKRTYQSPCSPLQKPPGVGSTVASSAADVGVPQEEPDDGDEEPRVEAVLVGPESPPSATTPNTDSIAVPAASSSMETLCEAAAAIIADVQGHNDRGLAFAALGCQGTAGCTVGNMRIFDVIDKTS